MNILTTTLAVLLISIFSTSLQTFTTTQKDSIVEKPIKNNGFIINDDDYTLHIELLKTDTKTPILVIAIELHDGSYYVSPFAKRDFKGKFCMDLANYNNLDFKDEIIGTPQSIEEVDEHPYVRGTINWVRENTTYKQTLLLKSKEDFEVFGRLRFTIEPRCSLEEIPFGIVYKDGVMRIISPKC